LFSNEEWTFPLLSSPPPASRSPLFSPPLPALRSSRRVSGRQPLPATSPSRPTLPGSSDTRATWATARHPHPSEPGANPRQVSTNRTRTSTPSCLLLPGPLSPERARARVVLATPRARVTSTLIPSRSSPTNPTRISKTPSFCVTRGAAPPKERITLLSAGLSR